MSDWPWRIENHVFDLIEPRRPGRGEMKMDFWVFLEPALVFLVGMTCISRSEKAANDAVHEAQKHDAATPLRMRRHVATSSAANKVVVPCSL